MPAMDPKIMAAVLASVSAIAIGTGGSGSFEDINFSNPGNLLEDRINPSNIFLDSGNNPSPNTSVRITAKLNANTTGMKVNSERIILENYDGLILGQDNITSDKQVIIKEFNGVLSLRKHGQTEIKGRSNGFSSSGVQVSGKRSFEGFIDSQSMEVINNTVETLSLKRVDVSIRSLRDSTLIEKDSSNLKIEDFRGNVSIYNENSSVVFEGFVSKTEAGGVSLST